jgi:hypothetical protein
VRHALSIALASLVLAAACASTSAQAPEPVRLGFVSYASSEDDLLPEERAAYEFCRTQSSTELQMETELVTLDGIASGQQDLSGFDVVWWHYARDPKLPPAALARPTLEAFSRYVKGGGSLLLSLQACQYVAALGIDVGPDQIGWKARAEVPSVALRSTAGHGIFGMLPERFALCGAGTIEPATYARWVKNQPKKGRLLAYAVIENEDNPAYRCIYEWAVEQGRVLAIGEYGFRFEPPEGRQGTLNLQFAANVLKYLSSPTALFLTLRPKGRTIAAPHIGYLGRILSGNTVLVERGTSVEVLFTCMPRERETCQIQVQFGQFDEKKSEWNMKDLVLDEELQLRPGRECSLKGRFSTGVSAGEYLVAAWVGHNNLFHANPDYVQRLYVVESSPLNATLADRGLVYTIETDQWLVELEKVTGAVKGLTHKRRPALNFAANEFNSPLAESKAKTLLGDFFVTSRAPRAAWVEEGTVHSTDVREVEIQGDTLLTKFLRPSTSLGGFATVRCVSSFSFNRQYNCLEWAITITNPGQGPIEVGSVHVPLAFNTAYNYALASAQELFSGRLIMRPDVCGASSSVVFEPRSGDPPYLVLVPAPGTPIECLAHDQKGSKSAGRDWEGLPYLYLYSKADKDIENWGGWFNGHTSFTLASGDSRTLTLRFFWAANSAEVEQILASQGKLSTLLSPGYVVPADVPATLRLACPLGVGSVVADKETTVQPVGEQANTYTLTFTRPGRHTLRITHGRGEITYLHLCSLPPLAEIARKRAAFILEHQQFKAPDDRRNLAFGMWDLEDQMLVDKSENKAYSGGSGVVGIGPALYLAAKNTVFPDATEVAALEEYTDKELLGCIQDKQTYAVHTFVDNAGDGPTSDSYVYPHVFNFYFAMYRIGAWYGLTRVPAVNYLRLAQRTAMAYLSGQMEWQANIALGNPGEGTLALIVAALHREKISDEAAQLQEAISQKLGVLAKQQFLAYGVFAGGRFWPADTTGISGIYWLSRAANWQDGLVRSAKVLAATRGNGRHWACYGADLAWASEIAKYPTLEATALCHPSAYNGAALLDAAVLWRSSQYAELGYSALLGPWARVRPTGEPQGFYAWEPKLARFDPWSGDVDAALAPTFFFLGSYVVLDHTFGLVGFGAQVTSDATTYTVVPADGMGKRVVSVPHRLVFEVGADLIRKVTVTKKGDRMDVEIARGWADDHDGWFALSGLPAGTYSVSLDGGQAVALSSEQLAAGVTIPFKADKSAATISVVAQAQPTQ